MMRNLAPGDLVKKAWDLCNQDWPGCSIMNMMHWKVIVFGGGHIVFQRFVHVRCHFQPLPTKLVFAYFDRGSYINWSMLDSEPSKVSASANVNFPSMRPQNYRGKTHPGPWMPPHHWRSWRIGTLCIYTAWKPPKTSQKSHIWGCP